MVKDNVGKYTRINEIVQDVQDGDTKAIKHLLAQFQYLIVKISNTINQRYKNVVDLQTILSYAKYLVIYLTIMEYKPDGGAQYPHFLKTQLHARLIQHFRPIIALRFRTSPIRESNSTTENDPSKIMYKKEREQLYDRILWYIDNNTNNIFSDKEQDIIKEYIMGNTTRKALAIKYGVTSNRIKNLEVICLRKLKRYLQSLGYGIRKADY